MLSARDINIKCDINRLAAVTGTDDTAALTAALNALALATVSGSGMPRLIIHGACLTGPLTLTRPIHIVGDGQSSSSLVLKSGSTAPLVTVAVAYDAVNYYTAGNPPADVTISDLEMTSQSNADAAGQGVAHGLALRTAATNPAYTSVHLDHVKIHNMPGNGIDGAGFGANGFLDADHVYLKANAGYNFNIVSNYDWRIDHADVNGAALDNILMSGSSGIVIDHSTVYSAGHNNLNYYQGAGTNGHGQNIIAHSAFDGAQYNGVLINHQGGYVTLSLDNDAFNNNSIYGQGYYGDVTISGDATKTILTRPSFDKTYTMNGTGETYKSAWNIWLQSGSTGNVTTILPSILGSDAQAYSDTSRVIKVHVDDGTMPLVATTGTFSGALSAPSATISGAISTATVRLASSAQNTGLILSNGTNNIATLVGLTGTNDGAQFSLLTGGVVVVNLSAAQGYAKSWIQSDLTLGNGASSATPAPYTLRATDGFGTDVAGANSVISGGRGTGAGLGGSILFQTAPAGSTGTAQNAGTNRLQIMPTGGVQNIGTVTVGTLGVCNSTNEGWERGVSDATSPAWNTALTGGGAVHVKARCNATAWVAD